MKNLEKYLINLKWKADFILMAFIAYFVQFNSFFQKKYNFCIFDDFLVYL